MKMQCIKSVIFTVLTLVIIGCFLGCSSKKEDTTDELQIKEMGNHLAFWQEKLPQDTTYRVLDASAVRGLMIKKDGETTFAVSYEPRKEKDTFDYWDISVPYQSLVSVNTEELYDLFGRILQINGENVAKIDIEEAGIPDSKTSVFIAYNGVQESGDKGKAEPTDAMTILIGNRNEQGDYYAALKGTEHVIVVDQALVNAILNLDAYQYILKLPVLIDVETVRKIQIIYGKKRHGMEQENNVWKLDGEEVEQEKFQAIYSKLLDIMLSGKIEDSRCNRAEQPILTVQYLRNMEDASDVEVKYYEYDDCSMSVSVNGQEYFLVDKKSIDNLQQVIEDSFGK